MQKYVGCANSFTVCARGLVSNTSCNLELVDQAVVVTVGSDPEPCDAIGCGDAEGAIPETYADRPELSDLFEMQGRMSWILFQQLKISIRQLLNNGRKTRVALPEAWRGMVGQSGLHWPEP